MYINPISHILLVFIIWVAFITFCLPVLKGICVNVISGCIKNNMSRVWPSPRHKPVFRFTHHISPYWEIAVWCMGANMSFSTSRSGINTGVITWMLLSTCKIERRACVLSLIINISQHLAIKQRAQARCRSHSHNCKFMVMCAWKHLFWSGFEEVWLPLSVVGFCQPASVNV